MDEDLVFHKTEKGQNEIGHPGGGLPPKQRRCLIMVDGAKSVAELSAMFRPGEIDQILEGLVAAGYIALDAAQAAAHVETHIPHFHDAQFDIVRQRAMREVSERLGPNGDPLAIKLEECETPAQLRHVLREAEVVMTSFLGAEYAKTFARKLMP